MSCVPHGAPDVWASQVPANVRTVATCVCGLKGINTGVNVTLQQNLLARTLCNAVDT